MQKELDKSSNSSSSSGSGSDDDVDNPAKAANKRVKEPKSNQKVDKNSESEEEGSSSGN